MSSRVNERREKGKIKIEVIFTSFEAVGCL